MKRKIGRLNLTPAMKAIKEMILKYNEKHKDDPIVSFTGHFQLAEKTKTINIK
jgi:hypothetical protein